VEALRRAFYDRNTKLGDPGFVEVDAGKLFAPGYVAAQRAAIVQDKATPSLSLGMVAAVKEGVNTTHLSIVDKDGNAVALTYTINDWFGARVTASGVGILMNNEMDDFTAKPGVPNMFGLVEGANNAIAHGKRPLSSMSPVDGTGMAGSGAVKPRLEGAAKAASGAGRRAADKALVVSVAARSRVVRAASAAAPRVAWLAWAEASILVRADSVAASRVETA
jgi:hypothetical protein